MPDDLMPLARVAARLQTSATTLLRWSKRGEFPVMYRVGRKWLVRESAVEAWMLRNTSPAHAAEERHIRREVEDYGP